MKNRVAKLTQIRKIDIFEEEIPKLKDNLLKAEEAFDDEDFDDAIDLAEEAEDLADEAIDEL